jgi:regulatory protein
LEKISYSAEQKALDYLDRSEHSRFLLQRKLVKKGYPDDEITNALDSLEERGTLSDSRYVRAWLRNRSLQKNEGRRRLAAELAVRGIARDVSADALDAFFDEIPENERCKRAADKYLRTGNKTKEQAEAYLLRQGFPSAAIRECLCGGDQ